MELFLQPRELKYICFAAVNEWVELISDKASCSSGTRSSKLLLYSQKYIITSFHEKLCNSIIKRFWNYQLN